MLSRVLAVRAPDEVRANPSTWGTWPGDAPMSATGVAVTQSSAMQLLAVSGCVRLITDSIATLPVDVMSGAAGVEVRKPDWLVRPTTDLDFTAWVSQVLSSLLLHGNAFVVVTRNASRAIVELTPVDPSLVQVHRPVGGRKSYIVRGQPYAGEILHICGMMMPGADVGLSPLEYAKQSIGLGLAAIEYGSDTFASSLNMPGVIQVPGKPSPDQVQNMANAWKRNRNRRNRGLPGVLTEGATWTATGVTNEQAQFLQTRQWTAAEISGQVFMIDPREFGIPITGSTLDYTTAESRKTNLLTKALLPWIIRLEHALSGLLPLAEFLKFNVDGFLRGDSAARWTTYEAAMRINTAAAALGQSPVLLTDEIRSLEDLAPVDAPALPPVAPTP